jgi:hypothetical protein
MGITVRITGTVSVTIQVTISKGTVTSRPTLVGRWGRQTHGQVHKMLFTYTAAWKAYNVVMQMLLSSDESPIHPVLFD